MKERVVLSWSGGKDSALALFEIHQNLPDYEVTALLTTVTEATGRVAGHGVRRALLEAQADAVGLPLEVVMLPESPPNRVYEERVGAALARHRDAGVATIAFGDLFLEDIRRYRETLAAPLGVKPIFPIWGKDTRQLATDFVEYGFDAMLVCVDTGKLDASWLGRTITEQFLRELPAAVDPCGENGEFHTFAFDGPIFDRVVEFRPGEKSTEGPLALLDLVPKG
jgi:uncharacterized protein (TIGR00290 family)